MATGPKYSIYCHVFMVVDRLCCLVVRVTGYRSRGPGFNSRRYQIFWEVVGLERGPLSLVRITEELLEWKSSGYGQENRINDQGDPLRWPHDTLYPQTLALTLLILPDVSECFIEDTELAISIVNFQKFIAFHVSRILSSYNLCSHFTPVH
jgi:hypothetical protein